MALEDSESGSRTRAAAQFATTHWSTVLAAGDSALPGSREALERLCRTYWYPLYAFVRRKGYSPEDAKDLTQAFFERFLEKHYLKAVEPEKGRFRSFLLKVLTHFLANEWDRAHAAKRGRGPAVPPAIPDALEEQYGREAVGEESPERHFDRLWAEALMDRAMALLEEEYRAAGKAAVFEALVSFLSDRPAAGEYAAVGERLGLSGHAVAMAVARLRDRYGVRVRTEIANTVDDPSEVKAELRYVIELVTE
jgi:RNA polymerase sigma-70 factor (ECF subfamily)